MDVLVDSSVWIDYFKGAAHSAVLDTLIDENDRRTMYDPSVECGLRGLRRIRQRLPGIQRVVQRRRR